MSDITHAITQKRDRRRQTMKAFVISRYGKANSVEAVELPDPQWGTVTSWSRFTPPASIPWISRLKWRAQAPLPYKLPLVLGNDLAGVVIKPGKCPPVQTG